MPLLPLLYIAMGFFGGYLFGRRSAVHAVETTGRVSRDASAVLESVGQLSQAGALASIGDLKLRQGTQENGVELVITTHDWVSPARQAPIPIVPWTTPGR